MKKIVILFNLNRHKYEYETEFDSEYTINSIYDSISDKYEVYKVEADKKFEWIQKIIDIHPDLVFNVCEGYYGPARESVYGAIIEQLGLNYSGPDSTNLLICHNKYLSKKILSKKVKTPFGYIITKAEEINLIPEIKYPVIIKLNSEGSSMGMTQKSIVYNFNDMKKQAIYLLNKYKRSVLIEQYIKGTDMSMIFVEGLGPLGPCIVDCSSEFYDYEMKTIKDNTVNINTVDGNYEKLKNIVNIIVNTLDIKGYSKMDFRFDGKDYYLIEVNAQVSFHPQGEFITCAKTDNYNFNKIINIIIKNALQKKQKINSVGWRE